MSIAAPFFNWWIDELRGLLPATRAGAAAHANGPVICLEAAGNAHIIDPRRGEAGPLQPLAEIVAGIGRRYKAVRLRVRSADCLVRTVALPAAATRDFAQMLRLDLERSTPLKASDVLAAHMVVEPHKTGGMVQVRHLVIKSRTVSPALAALREAGIEVVCIDCWSHDGAGPVPVNFLADQIAAVPAPRSNAGRWAAAAVATGCIAAYLVQVERQQHALNELSAATARLQIGVREIQKTQDGARTMGAGIAQLRRIKADRQPATLILEEVTRLLPDSAWLQEFRLDNDVVEIAGLAASAASLLPLFERSALFHESSFTAPLRVEPGEDRERFRLRTKLKPLTTTVDAPRKEAGQ